MHMPAANEASPTDRTAVTIELGCTRIPSDELANVVGGALVVLDQTVDAPLNVYANDRLIARGEIVVVNENFCVRVTELVTHVNEVA